MVHYIHELNAYLDGNGSNRIQYCIVELSVSLMDEILIQRNFDAMLQLELQLELQLQLQTRLRLQLLVFELELQLQCISIRVRTSSDCKLLGILNGISIFIDNNERVIDYVAVDTIK